MKALAQKLWTEPAYFVGAICTIGLTVLQIVNWPDAVEIPLTVLLSGGGFHVVRNRVTPTKR